MDESPKIVLVDRLPEGFQVDVLFTTARGLVIPATAAEIAALRALDVAVAQLYESYNDYCSAVFDLSAEQAVATVDGDQDRAFALLSTSDKAKFGIA